MNWDRLALSLLAALLIAHGTAQAQASKSEPPTRSLRDANAAAVAIPTNARLSDGYDGRQRRAFDKYGPLGVVTLGMEQNEIVVLCHTVAQSFGAIASEETDHELRVNKLAEVWRFEKRLAEPLERARREMGEIRYSRATAQSGQTMNLLSMMPDPQIEKDLRAGDDLMFAWMTGLASRCGQMLDEMGIAKVSGDPPPAYLETKTRFRYRGADYADIFAETELAPYAENMCRDGPVVDFIAAPLDQRGMHGMSLLDWAVECDDRSSFDALVAAGFDLDAKGLWEDPPLVRTANEKRLWFLGRLLDEGVNPDTMGRTKTALLTANDDLDAINSGGDERAAFNLLRARGASLSFPNFRDSMWHRWSLHETRWDLILEHWEEFESDPVELASKLEYYFSGEMNWARKETEDAAREVKALLIQKYGVCFPVGRAFDMETDERGFRIQPDCPSAY